MVAGQHAEAAGIDGHAFGEPVLGGEVGDELAIGVRVAADHVRVELLAGELILSDVTGIVGGAIESALGNAAQHGDGVVAGVFPEGGIEAAEQSADRRLPGPENVVGEFGHPRQLRRQRRADDKFPDGLNIKWHGL